MTEEKVPDNNKKSKFKIFEKVLMGAVIGGAIGSVIGASIAPKKGKETRKDIADTAKKAKSSSISIFKGLRKLFSKKKPELKKIPHEHV